LAKPHEPEYRWNIVTALSAINMAALTHCINCSLRQTPHVPPSGITLDSSAWAATASPFDGNSRPEESGEFTMHLSSLLIAGSLFSIFAKAAPGETTEAPSASPRTEVAV
jgi:hypothetical protein